MLGVFFVYVCVMMALSDSCSIMACFRLVVFPVIPLAFAYSMLILLALVLVFLLMGLRGGGWTVCGLCIRSILCIWCVVGFGLLLFLFCFCSSK